MRDMLARLNQLQAETLIITDQSNREAREQHQRAIVVPCEMEELFTPIPYIIPAQMLAARLAFEKGVNPDAPRTLSKVTRTL